MAGFDALQGQNKESDVMLEQYRSMRISLLKKFHRLRKFLGIVLDGEILRRILRNPMALSLPEVSPRNRLQRADRAELFETQTLASRNAQDPIKRLCDVLYHQDDYLEKKLLSVELLIDDAIAKHCAASELETTDDYSILLEKLEDF